MLDKLSYESMQPYLNAEFRVVENDAVLASLILVEVRDLVTPATAPAEGARTPFSLLFQAPLDYRVSQSTLSLENQTLGRLDIFLVPIHEDEYGIYYEAIFN